MSWATCGLPLQHTAVYISSGVRRYERPRYNPHVTRPRLLLERILRGDSDASIPFDDLRNLLRRLGFGERLGGTL